MKMYRTSPPDHSNVPYQPTRPQQIRPAVLTAPEEPLRVDHGLQTGDVVECGGDGAARSLHGGDHALWGPLHLQVHRAREIVHTLSGRREVGGDYRCLLNLKGTLRLQ